MTDEEYYAEHAKLKDLPANVANFINRTWRYDSENGQDLLTIEEMLEEFADVFADLPEVTQRNH